MEDSPPRTRRVSRPEHWREWMLAHNFTRAHLSSERTFLGWLRTSLALITLGFVVQRFNLLLDARQSQRLARFGLVEWAPIVFFAFGGILAALGAWEYFSNRKRIESGETVRHPPLRDALVITALVFLVLVAGIFLVSRP
jgi:putative membrane protein